MADNEVYILPSNNDEMKLFIEKFKVDMMINVISSIKYAVDNKLSVVEVFQFKNSPFVVTISDQEFVQNIEHISKFCRDNEIFELYPKIDQLSQILKNKTNEKEK